ncbi:helix-turn-helix transcriptional regulator [Microbacterium sp. XT11]|uniref:helix-turn-helix transcriptional regulator n=1 Tax=Microbacterium sp. XT11 TaxID=367477 RepID=UPI000830A573|nr:LuxR family transcriptional regulator [Microbacterium sp. XT11]
MLSALLARGHSCAPHVFAALASELADDAVAIREVVETLDPAQRHGLRPLPSPLPLVESIRGRYADLELSGRDLQLLLATALCLLGKLDPLLEFDGRSAEQIASSPVGRHLSLHAGMIRFVDPRLAIWIRGTAGRAEEKGVHARLADIFRARGDRVSADWHRARASLHRDADAAPELTRIARELSEAGESDRALLLASEAAVHSSGVARDEARLVAGASAIAAGYAVEASAWLGGLFPDGAERYRLQGLSGLLVARAHLQGAVPDVEPAALRPRTDDHDDWYSWARAAAFGAVLCAERGDRPGMRAWLDALRDACVRVGAERDLRDPVVALAWLIAGDRDVDAIEGAGPLTGAMLGALRCAMDGDIDRALRLLAVGESGLGAEVDPFVAGFEHSPLVRAYRAVVEVLLLTWRGDIGLARDRLIAAALELPIAMPFAGVGVVLARRLDLAVIGRVGAFAAALTEALPPALRIDQFVDKGIEAYLAGRYDEAAAYVRLWTDAGSRQHALSVPGLDEVALSAGSSAESRRTIESAENELARRLRARVAMTPEADWRHESRGIAEEARRLRSPFGRARVEAMMGIRFVIREETNAARQHFRCAWHLFTDAGADAWARSVAARLERLDAGEIAAPRVMDPLEVCRSVWEPVLTPRELEVAMHAAGGASNREIGDALGVSVRTVEVHLGRAFTKLGVRSRVELTVLAHRTGRLR